MNKERFVSKYLFCVVVIFRNAQENIIVCRLECKFLAVKLPLHLLFANGLEHIANVTGNTIFRKTYYYNYPRDSLGDMCTRSTPSSVGLRLGYVN